MISKKDQLFEQLWTVAKFLKKYRVVIIVSVIILAVIGTVYAASSVPKVFYSTAKIYVRPNRAEYLSNGASVSEYLAADGAQIAQSVSVLKEAISDCGLQDLFTAEALQEQMYAYTEPQSRILVVMVADTEPDRAQLLAQNICESAVKRINEITNGDWATIADKANLPEKPEYPILWEIILQSVGFGLGVWFFLAVLYSLQEHRISSESDVKKYLGLSLLGSIPEEKGISSRRKNS